MVIKQGNLNMDYNLNENFIKSVERFHSRIAIETKISGKWQSLTYGRLGEMVKNLAFFISSLGIKKSDRVAIMLENRPEWAVIFFALSYIGAVAVPLDPQSPEKDVGNILSDSGACLAFISKENQRLSEFMGRFEGIRNIVVIGLQEKQGKRIPFLSEGLSIPGGFKQEGIDPDDLMVILYTSGTTDIPKGVMLTHKNLCANFSSLNRLKLFSCRDVVLSVLPLYHSYSLMVTLILQVFSGARIVYVPSDWPEKLTDYLKETKASVFVGVPQIFHMMHAGMMKKIEAQPVFTRLYIKIVMMLGLGKVLLPKLRNAFGGNIRFFASGGAALDKTVGRDFFKLGFKILEGYGLTETSPVASFNPIKRPKIGSAGIALPDVKLKIINKDRDGIGEIAIHGPNVMKGYYKDEVKTGMVIKDGWFLSGDLGYIDKDGYLYITGRSKEVIVLSSGKNIYPEEIERHYSAAPYVKEMCALGVVKEKGMVKRESLYAVIVPDMEFCKERGEMNVRKAIKKSFEELSKDLPAYKHIMGFSVTRESLPRTVLGKLKRHDVKKIFVPVILNEERKKDVECEEKKLSESDTARQLITCIKNALDIKTPVNLRDSIELDLGVDSLGRVELLFAIEKCFDIEIPEEMAAGEVFTVKDLLLKIEGLLRKKHESAAEGKG